MNWLKIIGMVPWDETWELQFKEIVNKAPALESWTV